MPGTVDGRDASFFIEKWYRHLIGQGSINPQGGIDIAVWLQKIWGYYTYDAGTDLLYDGRSDEFWASMILATNPSLIVIPPPTISFVDSTIDVSDTEAIGFAVSSVENLVTTGDALVFSITAGNGAGKFSIDADTGLIELVARVDFYEASQYSLTVQVSNAGGTDSAVLTVDITVGDTVLLLDNFTIDDAAPLADPLVCDGAGSLDTLQTDGTMSISASKLVATAPTTPDFNRQGFKDVVTRTRAAGVMLRSLPRFDNSALTIFFWGTGTNLSYTQALGHALYRQTTVWFLIDTAGNTPSLAIPAAINTDFDIAIVMADSGYRYFIGGKLVFRTTINSNNAVASWCNATANMSLDQFQERQLAGYFLDDNLFLLNQVTPISGTAYDTASVNDLIPGSALIQLDYTTPATTAGAIIELKFNYIDDTHCWIARVKRNAGNTNWDYELVKVDGTEAVQASATGIGANGRIVIRGDASLRDAWVQAQAATPVKRGAQVNVSFQNTSTQIKVVTTGAGWTLTSLQAEAVSSLLYGRVTA